MKIKAIEAIIKANKTIVIIKEDGCQWLGNGSALYPLYDFPKMNQQNIFAMFDIPEDKREKYAYRESTGETLSGLLADDYPGEMQVGQVFGLSLLINGAVTRILDTSQGAMFIDQRYLKPFCDDSIELFERKGADGRTYIAVKKGFFLAGLILPLHVIDEKFCKDLFSIYDMCRAALVFQSQKQAEQERPEDGSDE